MQRKPGNSCILDVLCGPDRPLGGKVLKTLNLANCRGRHKGKDLSFTHPAISGRLGWTEGWGCLVLGDERGQN